MIKRQDDQKGSMSLDRFCELDGSSKKRFVSHAAGSTVDTRSPRGGLSHHNSMNLVRLNKLFNGALIWPLVGSPAHKFGAMAKAVARNMVEPHLDDELRTQRLPLTTPLGTPAADGSRCHPGKAGRLTQ